MNNDTFWNRVISLMLILIPTIALIVGGDNISDRMTSLEDRLGRQMSDLGSRMLAVEKQVASVETRLSGIEQKLSHLSDRTRVFEEAQSSE